MEAAVVIGNNKWIKMVRGNLCYTVEVACQESPEDCVLSYHGLFLYVL